MKILSILRPKDADCSVVFDPQLDKGQAILSDKNPLNLKKADKLAIKYQDKIYFYAVNSLVSTNAPKTDDITIRQSLSSGQGSGRYWKISEIRYRAKAVFGPPKSRIALIGFLLTLVGAAATAYRAYHVSGAGQNHDHLVTWSLLIVTALGAFLSWAKEVI